MLKHIRPPQSTASPFPCPAPRIDLKVCEGCGALWVRAQAGSTPAGVYCRRCAGRLSSFPRAARLTSVPPPPARPVATPRRSTRPRGLCRRRPHRRCPVEPSHRLSQQPLSRSPLPGPAPRPAPGCVQNPGRVGSHGSSLFPGFHRQGSGPRPRAGDFPSRPHPAQRARTPCASSSPARTSPLPANRPPSAVSAASSTASTAKGSSAATSSCPWNPAASPRCSAANSSAATSAATRCRPLKMSSSSSTTSSAAWPSLPPASATSSAASRLEEHTQAEAAALLGMSLRTLIRRYAGALDTLTRIFLDRKLLHPLTAAEL